jgi:hypothetical protein
MKVQHKPRIKAVTADNSRLWICERPVEGEKFVGMACTVIDAWKAAHPPVLPPIPWHTERR